ncbi:MAG: hypothetical protein PHU06_00140 [Gallionella sp.]|nr:hypothetical protein [Gallionella sp.]MDD4958644.1 hypothetical protein [Gallionella sp.]
MNHDLILCGWRVCSTLPLPELMPWMGDDRPVDIDIRVADIPAPTDVPILVLPHSRLWRNGDFLLELDGVGRFWVAQGRQVLVEPAPDCPEAELRAFILGSVLGVLCHQRGYLPIHASAVRIDEVAVLIAGISGAGKSTLAAALGARGHALLSDDVAAIDPKNGQLLPAYPQRKLTPDVLNVLQMSHEGLLTHRVGQVKFRVPAFADFSTAPIAPAAVFVLNVSPIGPFGAPERLSSAKSMALLDNMIYRRAVGQHIQPKPVLFSSIAKLAQLAPVYTLPRRKGAPLSELDTFAAQVEACVRGLKSHG